ncbi:kinase-like domain, phloem protein 2-like protein [Tanacetum coccineum]
MRTLEADCGSILAATILHDTTEALDTNCEEQKIHSAPDHLAHLRIPLEDIESATNYFHDKNVIGKGGFGKRYKGQLLWSDELIDINARRLINKEWNKKEQQFWMEIAMLSSLKHKNVVSIVGFCNEVGAETIIYKHESRGRLKTYLSDPKLLTWVKRLEICVGVAHALRYIHYDEPRDFSVIHGKISSYTVQLNNDWEPKLSDFQHSMKIKASERHHSFPTDSVWSRSGYTDPTCLETNIVNQNSDIYSFGIVLFELLCGRKSVSVDQDNKYLVPLSIFHYREKILDDIIDPDLRKQMDPRSLNILVETAYRCLNEEQSQRPNMDQIVTRLEKALELQLECENAEHSSVVDEVGGTSSSHEEGSASHSTSTGIEYQFSKNTMSSLKYLSHSQLSYEDIRSATNYWARENIINQKTVERVYQGHMLHFGQFMDIVARRIYPKFQKDMSKKFRMEKLMLSSLNHTNLVSAIGFPNKNNHMLIVYKKEANGSLNTYLSDQTLTWTQRLKICLGVANALSYIHYDAGRDFSVIHCNIRSSKILLDDKWEPKLSGFQLALKNTVPRRHRLLLTRDVTENVYVDPKYKKTGGMTHKSDVYSFGVVLLEILCGRSAVFLYEKLGEGLLSKLVKSNLDDMIDPHLRKQIHPESLKLFSETAYCCVKEERADRPYIDQVVKTLEKAFELQWKHENPEPPRNAVGGASYNHLKGKNLEHLKIPLNDINQATNDFDEAQCIGSGGFGKVYKADLEHFDSNISSSIEDVSKCDLPRKRSTIGVKHEEIGKLKEVQQVLKSDFNVGQAQQLPTNFEEIFKISRNYDDLFWLGEVEGKKLLVLSAKAALYKFSNVDIFTSKPPAESRFQEVIELLPQQVFHLKCTIKSQMLSPVTEYVCYLVFKLSEKFQGLHCPVEVQDVLHKENNEAEFVYFITPSPLNTNDITRVPKQREDGWMEIQLWKFNSTHEFKDDSLSMNMKFTTHQGTMSGLVVCGLEFRPMFSGNSDDIQRQREKKNMLQDEVLKATHSA